MISLSNEGLVPSTKLSLATMLGSILLWVNLTMWITFCQFTYIFQRDTMNMQHRTQLVLVDNLKMGGIHL